MATLIALNQMINAAHGIQQCDLFGTAGVSATDTGKWVWVGHLTDMSIEVNGINGDTVTFRGCNLPFASRPADGDDYAPIGGSITSDQMVAVIPPMLWIKGKVTIVSGTAVKSRLVGHVRR